MCTGVSLVVGYQRTVEYLNIAENYLYLIYFAEVELLLRCPLFSDEKRSIYHLK